MKKKIDIFKYLKLLPGYTIAFIILIIIKFFSPFIKIRLASIDFSRIGDAGIVLLWYNKMRYGNYLKKKLDLFFITNTHDHINLQWYKMWKRTVKIIPFSSIWNKVLYLNKFLPNYRQHMIPNYAVFANPHGAKLESWMVNELGENNLEDSKKIKSDYIYFSEDEKIKGENYLEKIGILKNKFICFSNRDPGYLNFYAKNKDWSYHDYRDSKIENYLPAAEIMAKKNIYSLRMGVKVQSRINNKNSKIIDYASSSFQ